MNYLDYVRDKYSKIVLKGKPIPLTERWEKALVAARCIFIIMGETQKISIKLLDQLDDRFMDAFEGGKPLVLDDTAKKNLLLLFRIKVVQNSIISYLNSEIPKLDNIILPAREKIDNGIYLYYVGNKGALLEIGKKMEQNIKNIDNSVNESFHDRIHEALAIEETISRSSTTKTDIQNTTNKFANILDLNELKW